tara:strand:+ start:7916 stop:8089 length:174 start_codon:yes stop_codon:yes gene_type:complete
MSIIKTTEGDAEFVLVEKFDNEIDAQQGRNPKEQTVKSLELKINNTKWKKEDEQLKP